MMRTMQHRWWQFWCFYKLWRCRCHFSICFSVEQLNNTIQEWDNEKSSRMLCRRFVRLAATQRTLLYIALWGYFLSLRMLAVGCLRVLVLLTMASQVALGISTSVRALNNWISLGEQSERTEQTEGLLLLFTGPLPIAAAPCCHFSKERTRFYWEPTPSFQYLIIVGSQYSYLGIVKRWVLGEEVSWVQFLLSSSGYVRLAAKGGEPGVNCCSPDVCRAQAWVSLGGGGSDSVAQFACYLLHSPMFLNVQNTCTYLPSRTLLNRETLKAPGFFQLCLNFARWSFKDASYCWMPIANSQNSFGVIV